MINDLNRFYNKVIYYLKLEYSKKYCKKEIFDFVKSYYWGGNNIPDTARATLDYMKMKIK